VAMAVRKMAAQVFETMLKSQDDSALTGLNLLLSILIAHGHKELAENFLGDAASISHECQGPDHPVTFTCKWMAAAATGKPASCGFGASILRQVYDYFGLVWGRVHPHTLLSLYNLAWTLILENEHEEAEAKLWYLFEESSKAFPRAHMQTITALTTLSRVLSKLGKHDQAVKVMEEAVDRSKDLLGLEHPKCLESRRRLAGLYANIGRHEFVEPIYREVLQGRIKTLGPKHKYTLGMLDDVVKLLQEQRRDDEAADLRSYVLSLEGGANDFYDLMKAY